VPIGVAAPAVSISVRLSPAVGVLFAVKPAVAPAGSPCATRVSDSAVPAVRAVFTGVVPPDPWPTVTVPGALPSEKLFAAQRGNLTLAIRVSQLKIPFAG
jgi:hypothetical protein